MILKYLRRVKARKVVTTAKSRLNNNRTSNNKTSTKAREQVAIRSRPIVQIKLAPKPNNSRNKSSSNIMRRKMMRMKPSWRLTCLTS